MPRVVTTSLCLEQWIGQVDPQAVPLRTEALLDHVRRSPTIPSPSDGLTAARAPAFSGA
jgi:hypothetical protein